MDPSAQCTRRCSYRGKLSRFSRPFPEEALVIAVPVALLGSLGELLAKTFSTVFVNAAEGYAQKGNGAGVSLMAHLGNIAHGLSTAIPVLIALVLGQDAVAAAQSAS